MTKYVALKNPMRYGFILALSFWLSGCAQFPISTSKMEDVPNQVVDSSKSSVLDYIGESSSVADNAVPPEFNRASILELVTKAKNSPSPRREALLIKATHTTLNQTPINQSTSNNDLTDSLAEQLRLAALIYQQIDATQLTQGDQKDLDYYYELIGLELAVAQKDKTAAQEKLQALDTISSHRTIRLSTKHYITDSKIRGTALSLQGNHIAAARLLVFRLEGVNLDPALRQNLHNSAWHYLTLHRKTNASDNKALAIQTTQVPSEEWQAWLELNDIFELSHKSQLGLMHGKLKSWARDWSRTEVSHLPPLEVSDFMLADFKPATHIAVLLPTSGQLQHAGKAIIDGIMAAYYQEQSQSSTTLKLTVLDTAQDESIESLYHKAQQQGAEFVIGPLEKEEVETLKKYINNLVIQSNNAIQASDMKPVPVLALNYTNPTDSVSSTSFFEFGLSAEDEAEAVAQRAIENGMQRALIIRPNSPWGERVSQAFKTKFQQLNGQILDEAAFSEPTAFSKEVAELLGITASQARHREMELRLNQKLDYTPRRREDVDFIFLTASPDEARQLKPTINYHYGQNIPVLSTSHIYSGSIDRNFDKDLNNVQFTDIPWVLQKNLELKEIFEANIPNSQTQFQRLHALGIDSFGLMREFPILKHVSSSELKGATGTLKIEADGRVKRTLLWATFRKGQVQLLKDAMN